MTIPPGARRHRLGPASRSTLTAVLVIVPIVLTLVLILWLGWRGD